MSYADGFQARARRVAERGVPLCLTSLAPHPAFARNVPLVVREVNLHALKAHRGIIANPNCSTMQMVVALKPIYDAVGIKRINVATYQSVSGGGKKAIDELLTQTTAILNGEPPIVEGCPKQIAFNAVPHIDTFEENGYTREEMKMVFPSSARIRMRCLSSTLARGSRPAAGSSMMRT